MHRSESFQGKESLAPDEAAHEGGLTLRARETARQAGFEDALEKLREQHLLAPEIARVKAQYEKQLLDAESFMTEDTWEAFTVMELYHPETADHCANTYRLAREKVERRLSGSGVLLSELFNEEKVALGVFYRACLLHDVGKVDIPYDIIANTVSDRECAYRLASRKDDPLVQEAFAKGQISPTDDPEELIWSLAANGRRPKDIAPARLLLSPEVADALAKRGVEITKTIAELIRPHEMRSAAILEALGFYEEGRLVARHHNYQNLPADAPVAVGTLEVGVDLAEILHLADVEQAMMAHRKYQLPATDLDALLTLVAHAERHFIRNADVAAVWVLDDLGRLYPGSTEEGADEVVCDPDEYPPLAAISAFLKKHDPVRLGTRTVRISIPSLRCR